MLTVVSVFVVAVVVKGWQDGDKETMIENDVTEMNANLNVKKSRILS